MVTWIFACIYLLNECLVSIYYVPGPYLGIKDMTINKRNKITSLSGVYNQ